MLSKIIKHKNLLTILILLPGSILSMLQVLQGSWPHNHEMDSFIRWTLVYAAHQSRLDFFPIWSMSDNYFFGGPSPLLYHKIFYFISALFQNLFDNNQFSIILTVIFFLSIGSIFMYVLILDITKSWQISLFGGLTFIFCNYTFTNWFIRGAMAEFSLAMLFPLILYLVYCYSIKNKYSFLLGLFLGLGFLAHSSVFYFMFLTLAPLFLFHLIIYKNIKNLFRLILGFLIPILPYVFLIWQLREGFGLNNILIYRPQNEFVPALNYLWDSGYVFGDRWDDFTVVLDEVLLILLFIIFARFVFVSFSKKKELNISLNHFEKYLMLSLLFYLMLQLPFSKVFYLNFPGAQYLQFPWRLLSLLLPILILLICVALSRFFHKKSTLILVSILLPLHIFLAPNFKPITYPRMDISNLQIDSNTNWISEETGSYYPQELSLPTVNSNLYFESANLKNCEIQNGSFIPGDLLRSFIFSCLETEKVLFPLVYSDFFAISLKLDSQSQFQLIDFVEDAGYISITLPKGAGELSVEAPNMFGALKKTLF
jgi:hypothetical protein